MLMRMQQWPSPGPCQHRCNGRAREFETFSTIEDVAWDLKAYTGWSPSLQGVVVAFRGTDSHSLGNWVENMRYWRTDFKLPYPGADGSKIHTGRPACWSDRGPL